MLKKLKDLKKIRLLKLFRFERIKKKMILIIVLTFFLVGNLLISPVSFHFDFSNGRAYTLSDSTRKILRNLKDKVEIKFFVSSDLPTKLLPAKNDIADFLNEYKKEGRGRVMIRIMDPKKDPEALKQVQEAGIPELQFSQLEQNKYAVTTAYFGMTINVRDKKEIIAQVTDLESLEYNLTAAIYKLEKKDLIKIAIVGKAESFDPSQDDLATLKRVLRQQFDVSFIEKETGSAYKSIIVFDDSQKKYAQEEIDGIKKYLSNKGTAIFFVDGVWVLDDLQTARAEHNLFGLLRDWGIELNKDLVLSTAAELVNFGNGSVQFFTPYPFWLKTNNFNQKSGFFSNINQLTFPWVSSLKLDDKNDELVKSMQRSWVENNNFNLNPQTILQPEQKDLKTFVVAAHVKKKDGGEIIVIPSSRFIQERYLTRTSDNLEFVINILNELTSGGALSGIRQRAVSFYPLPDIPDNQKDIFKYLNILLLPGLFTLFGGIRLFKRR